MDFHGGSVTGATAEKLSEIPRFHKRYSKGLMTMETALEMETWNHEDQHVFNTNGRLNEYYTTYKEAEIRDLTRGLAEATKVKKNIARLRDDAQTIRRRLRSSHLAMVDGTYLESDYKVIKEPETKRDLYLVPQANKGKKAELGVAICWDSSVLTSENPSWTASGFGDGNQTRLSNLNQDKVVMLGK
ncbi:hypothetical protein F2Q70_00005568 [Brassica cretica]|uniref:Uncharacterized protein n=1 Tax=Brassica cretica TaxID=69181 RepID=A0A8S9ITT7_BRACR|nr:hypothetical protein F2Q70_00005568 [Brassica cretica]